MALLSTLTRQNAEFKAWRQHIHACPETAFEEIKTADYIADLLSSWGVPLKRGLAKTAVVGTLMGKKNTSGRTIALRADMDALNITEETNLPHQSKNHGKMHACGHDGHSAMLLTATKHLAEHRNFDGTVHVIFQPAEEKGGGANVMIKEGFFDQFPCEAVFGLHNWPWLPAGKIAVREGAVTASTDAFEVTITGKGGHAAIPHASTDVVTCAATIVSSLQTLVSRKTDPLDSAVVSVCKFWAGTDSLNVLPETVALGGTVRSFKPETRRMLEEQLKRIIQSTAEAWGCTADIIWHVGYPSVVNTPKETALAHTAAVSVVGADNVTLFTPTMGGEDFAYFLQKRPGAYIMVGQGDGGTSHSHGLHSPHYDFNDNIIPIGAAYWINLVEKALPLK